MPAQITLDEQIREIGRELGLRRGVYPRLVSQGKMKQEEATRHLEVIEAVYENLKAQKTDARRFEEDTPAWKQGRLAGLAEVRVSLTNLLSGVDRGEGVLVTSEFDALRGEILTLQRNAARYTSLREQFYSGERG